MCNENELDKLWAKPNHYYRLTKYLKENIWSKKQLVASERMNKENKKIKKLKCKYVMNI